MSHLGGSAAIVVLLLLVEVAEVFEGGEAPHVVDRADRPLHGAVYCSKGHLLPGEHQIATHYLEN
jgi:hypothetical protein